MGKRQSQHDLVMGIRAKHVARILANHKALTVDEAAALTIAATQCPETIVFMDKSRHGVVIAMLILEAAGTSPGLVFFTAVVHICQC